MKTLDEVIKALEYCTNVDESECYECPVFAEPDCMINADALHYLNEYRNMKKALDYKAEHYERMIEKVKQQGQEWEDRCQAEIARYQEAVKNCELAENKFRKLEGEMNQLRRDFVEDIKNEPLTWEELCKMIGKPVWIEDRLNSNSINGKVSGWHIVSTVWNSENQRVWTVSDLFNKRCFTKESFDSGEWQAYRKERE